MQCGVSLFFFPSPLRCWSRLGTYNSADVQILLERNRKKRRRKSAKQLKVSITIAPSSPFLFFLLLFFVYPWLLACWILGEGSVTSLHFFPSHLLLCIFAFSFPLYRVLAVCCSVEFSAWVRYAEGLDRRGRRESSRGLARPTVSVPLLSARMEYMFTYRKMSDGNQEGEREKRLLGEGVCAVPSSHRLSQVLSPLPPSHPIHLFHDPSGPCHPRTTTHIPP
ncbi:hypothetical protein CPAR01_08471 [Colletotrichum paranaense]|uniref:Uncharacterized protein n=1 Tax=Colletotrichum paranaense TaxID=1914294 RepID=A0ABQ9SKD2_9PEZI|nr:uncharacterized protein CPAR01_08471 [Colletotrichum paranaense]KAK1538358.1 hypothetical protein CPAR01_08471 [Colletotrichum paranaense]